MKYMFGWETANNEKLTHIFITKEIIFGYKNLIDEGISKLAVLSLDSFRKERFKLRIVKWPNDWREHYHNVHHIKGKTIFECADTIFECADNVLKVVLGYKLITDKLSNLL